MAIGVHGKDQYVNNPIRLHGQINAVRANHYVKDLGALQRYNNLNRGYGQSPRVEDDANASKLLGAPRLHEICIA